MKINTWTVYVRTPAGDSTGWCWVPLGSAAPLANGSKRWAPLKMAREPRQRPGRNSYHLDYSLLEQRIAEGTDRRQLGKREPELAALLEQCLPVLLRVENFVSSIEALSG